MKKTLNLGLATILLATSISNTHANETCTQLQAEQSAINLQIGKILVEYPGTHLVLGTCAAIASQADDETGAVVVFSGCAAIACAVGGFANCFEVGVQWFGFGLRKSQIAKMMRNNSCVSS